MFDTLQEKSGHLSRPRPRSPILFLTAHFSCMLLRHNFPLFVYTVSLLYLRRWARHQSLDIFVQSSPHFGAVRSSKTQQNQFKTHAEFTLNAPSSPSPSLSTKERKTKQFNYGKTTCVVCRRVKCRTESKYPEGHQRRPERPRRFLFKGVLDES